MKHWSAQERWDRWMGPAFQRPPDPTVSPEGAGPLEQQARRTLRWYAPSWREAHGEELVATVLDAAPDSGSAGADESNLPWKTRFDLALGGLRQRRRARPSFTVRWRLKRGNEPLSWEGLAWLRDALDQRGYSVRSATVALFVSLAYALFFSRDTVIAGFVLWDHGSQHVLRTFLVYLLVFVSFDILLARVFSAQKRKQAIRRAGLDASGWPLAWNPSQPVQPAVTQVWTPPPAIRWVVGELRLALATFLVGGTVATVAAYSTFLGNSEPAKPLGMSVAPHISDLAWLAFLVSGACVILGVALTPGVVRRARIGFRPENRPRSLATLPTTSPGDIAHHISRPAWLIAVIIAAAPAMPVVGWALGAAEVAAIPILIALLTVVRRIEHQTGVAVHQRQVAAATGGRFWSDEWVPADTAGHPTPA